MRRSVLVAQASQHGPAKRAGELVASVLAARGFAVDVKPMPHVDSLDRYGAIVVGGPMRLGRWHREAGRFLHRHRTVLGRLPVAVFATERPGTDRNNGGIERALAEAPEVEPVTSAHFLVTAGRWSPDRQTGYDPDEVTRWADELAHELGA